MSINESLLLVAAVVIVSFFALRAYKSRRSADAQKAREATEEAARAAAEDAKRAAAERQAAEDAKRAAAERQAAEEAKRAAAERQAAEEAKRAAAERQAAEEAAQVEADRKAVEEALRAEEEERLAVAEAIARETERQAAEESARRDTERKAAEEAQRLAAASAPPVAPAKAKTPEETVVMIADDSKVVRVKTGRLLGTQRYQVVMAEDGLDAAQQIEAALPDVLITDVDMPGMSGLQLARQLRANAATARLPIIMVTSDSEQLRGEADAAGVDVLLGKPYPEEQLIAHIQRLANSQGSA